MIIHLITKSMQLFFLQSTFSLKLLQIDDWIWVQSLSFVHYLLWRRIKLDKLNGTLSGGLNCFAACYASVLKDTGVKERYYFIKHHNSVSLAPVSNMCLCLSSAQQQSVYSMPGFVWKKQPDLWIFSFLNLNEIAFYISEAWTLNELLTDWCTQIWTGFVWVFVMQKDVSGAVQVFICTFDRLMAHNEKLLHVF